MHIRPVGAAVFCQYLLDRTIHTMKAFCSVVYSCLEKAMQKLGTNLRLVVRFGIALFHLFHRKWSLENHYIECIALAKDNGSATISFL